MKPQLETLADRRNKHGDRRGFSNLRHGHAPNGNETKTYEAWKSMKNRCYGKWRADYKYYGGRGIKVCKRWNDFRNFLKDMGECPPGLTLDRKDTNGNYTPKNCRWATRKEQSMNTRAVRMLTFKGKTQCVAEWERELGFCRVGITMRLKRGWNVQRALSTPPRKGWDGTWMK